MNSNSTQICRLCLETSNGLVNIFETFQDSTVDSVLAKHFWFQINKDDGMPEWVCEICWSQTKTFHHFYKRLELHHENYFNSIVLVDEIKQEQVVSPIEAAVEAFLFVDKYEEETGVTIKTYDTQTPNMENSCDEDDDEKSNDQSEGEQTIDNDNEPSLNKPSRYLPSPSEIERQDAEIRKFFTMKCDICSDVEFDTLKKGRKHYRQVHKTSGHLICCGNKYSKRCDILDHIQYHVNPDAHRCDQCGKSCLSRTILREHTKCHGRANALTCSFCPKTYTSVANLNYHVREKHSTDMRDSFRCEQCDIIFPTRYKLTKHMNTVHGPSINNICEACGRSFISKNDLKYHIDLQHSTTPLPKAQCNICGTWVKHQRYLRQHLRMHQEVQEAQKGKVLNCPICKKKVQSKRLLANHIRYSHGERKHQCTFCDKAFRSPKILKEHIALHTGEDLYSCPYCNRTFKSNANMYSHRKKAHLEEWTRDKEEKERIKQIAPSETETTAKAVVDE
ncbi:transcription factor grauzone-like isoform X4 [Bradysia coprophila]|uniref:transcription factor grauzone-like isoform X4 n=1 Tax=Bradysia coprophila TaxID=38358 RepID=UPI00187D7F74|nr:transcription factor grauzone-like isoform X4 [Bradysia coprophila]